MAGCEQNVHEVSAQAGNHDGHVETTTELFPIPISKCIHWQVKRTTGSVSSATALLPLPLQVARPR